MESPKLTPTFATESQKLLARQMYVIAVNNGTLRRPEACEDCGEVPKKSLHGHHEDYAKPLDVAWLCLKCHHKRHRVSEATTKVSIPRDLYVRVRSAAVAQYGGRKRGVQYLLREILEREFPEINGREESK